MARFGFSSDLLTATQTNGPSFLILKQGASFWPPFENIKQHRAVCQTLVTHNLIHKDKWFVRKRAERAVEISTRIVCRTDTMKARARNVEHGLQRKTRWKWKEKKRHWDSLKPILIFCTEETKATRPQCMLGETLTTHSLTSVIVSLLMYVCKPL